ncbi:hypothetical protein [Granulicella arctica]|uniref:hypothetical protein n=1 Tax=Granulicella arctica TaxID=940613 RepID=UPI0021DFA3FB|nr:hypothetical protein [Granulicella arctica]
MGVATTPLIVVIVQASLRNFIAAEFMQQRRPDLACLDLSDAANEGTFPDPQIGAVC